MIRLLFIIISLFGLIFVLPVSSKDRKADSLVNQLKLFKNDDTVKVKLLNETAVAFYLSDSEKALNHATCAFDLAEELQFRKGMLESLLLIGNFYKTSNSQLAIEYALKATKIAEEINDKEGIAKSLNLKGMASNAIGKYAEAHEYLQNALNISENLNSNLLRAQFLINIGTTYMVESNYAKATECVQKAMRIAEESDDKGQIAACFRLLGMVHDYEGNHPLALEYQQKALDIFEGLGDKYSVTKCYISIGIIYFYRGDYQKSMEQYQGALENARETNDRRVIAICYINMGEIYQKQNNKQAAECFEKALKIAEETSNKAMIINVLHNFGDLYFSQENYQKSLEYYQESFKIAKEINNYRNICNVGRKIGAIHFKQENISAALVYTLNSLELALEINLLPAQKDIHKQLSELYAAKGDFKKAYAHQLTFKKLNDSIFNENNINKIAELEYTYKFEKEKQAIELDNKKNIEVNEKEAKLQIIVIVSLIVMIILISLFSFFLYRSNTFKHQTNLVLLQQKKEIEENSEEYIALNEEYATLNEELKLTNEQLFCAKKLIEKNEEKLRLLIENSNDILVMANENGEQFFVSNIAENLTGYKVEELLGAVENMVLPEDLDIVRQHRLRVLSNKNTPDTIQFRHKHKENGFVWFEAISYNYLDHPAIKAIVANFRDVSERKRVEQALNESEKEKARLLDLELKRINEELENNQRTMSVATLRLIQNTERDAQIIEKLSGIEQLTNSEGKSAIKTLISDFKRNSYNSNWDEFEILFEKIHRTFYEQLNNSFPNLTANERKLCAFLKLNMSNKDIGQITFQSDEALKKARLRLRQKLGLERETNLTTFLQNI